MSEGKCSVCGEVSQRDRLTNCDCCGGLMCTNVHAVINPKMGYWLQYGGTVYCPSCAEKIESGFPSRWEREFGESGQDNPYR